MANKDDLLNMNEKKGIKKPLIYGAIAFLVFIIGVLGYAIYTNSSKNQDNVVIPPQIEQNKQQNTMFKEVPIEETKPAASAENKNEKKQVTENNENLTQKLLKNEENNTTEKTIQPQSAKPEVKNEPVKKVKTNQRQIVKTKKAPAASKVKYYIQVAALMKYKKPNKKFLQLIKKEGYSYRLYETYYVKNGKKIEVIKILVGPFDKNNVRKELKKIKNTITQNAFIFKVK